MSAARSQFPSPAPVVWLKCVLLSYAFWQARGLLESWRDSPFDRFGGLAFVIWLSPWLKEWPGNALVQGRFLAMNQFRLLASGLGATFLGDIGSLNVARHVGLVLILLGCAPPHLPLLALAFTAAAWMPALGWLLNILGLAPASYGPIRVSVAFLGALLAWIAVFRQPQSVRRLAAPIPAIESSERSYRLDRRPQRTRETNQSNHS